MDQLSLDIITPQGRVLELLQVQRDKRGFYPFLTLRCLKNHLKMEPSDLRDLIEKMEDDGMINVGLINHCSAEMNGDGCCSRAHFTNRKNIPEGYVECVGCGEILFARDVLETWRDPYRGMGAEITIHVPGDITPELDRKVRHYNVIDL